MFSANTTTPDAIETARAVLRELIEAGRSEEALDAAIARLSRLRDQNTDLMSLAWLTGLTASGRQGDTSRPT